MRRVIWKFPLSFDKPLVVDLIDSDPILAGLDPQGVPCVWVEHADVEDKDLTVPCKIYVVGTGQPFDFDGYHVGSFQQGPFIWHVYEDLGGIG